MKQERWEEVKNMILSQFQVEYTGEEELDHGFAEVVEFEGPLGFMRAEYVVKPKQLGRKVITSHRAGSASREEILLSKDEEVSYLKLYLWSDEADDWTEVKQDIFS